MYMDEKLNNGMLNGLRKALKDRWGSLMYGTFIASWCIWNWEILYVTFVLDQDLLFTGSHKLKIDYLVDIYDNGQKFFDINLGVLLTDFIFLFLGPLLSAFFIVWIVPWMDRCFSKKGFENKFKSDQIETDYRIKYLKLKKKESEAETKEVEQNVKKVKQENLLIKEMPQKKKWDIEYENLSKVNKFKTKMADLQYVLYKRSGYTSDLVSTPGGPENLAFFDANGLVTRFKDNTNYIESTEKGRYFMKKYLEGTSPE